MIENKDCFALYAQVNEKQDMLLTQIVYKLGGKKFMAHEKFMAIFTSIDHACLGAMYFLQKSLDLAIFDAKVFILKGQPAQLFRKSSHLYDITKTLAPYGCWLSKELEEVIAKGPTVHAFGREIQQRDTQNNRDNVQIVELLRWKELNLADLLPKTELKEAIPNETIEALFEDSPAVGTYPSESHTAKAIEPDQAFDEGATVIDAKIATSELKSNHQDLSKASPISSTDFDISHQNGPTIDVEAKELLAPLFDKHEGTQMVSPPTDFNIADQTKRSQAPLPLAVDLGDDDASVPDDLDVTKVEDHTHEEYRLLQQSKRPASSRNLKSMLLGILLCLSIICLMFYAWSQRGSFLPQKSSQNATELSSTPKQAKAVENQKKPPPKRKFEPILSGKSNAQQNQAASIPPFPNQAGDDTAVLNIQSTPDGAKITINGQFLDQKTPLAPFLVWASQPLHITIQQEGFHVLEKTTTLEPGEQKGFIFELHPIKEVSSNIDVSQ